MNPNPENNSDKEEDADLAANQFVKMLEQQALYARIAKINEETKGGEDSVFEERGLNSLLVQNKPSKMVFLRWAVAASLIIGGVLFFLNERTSLTPQMAIENTEFRGTQYTQSRSVINGESIRTAYADIDDLIEKGELEKAEEALGAIDGVAAVTFRKGIIAYQQNDFQNASASFKKTIDLNDMEYFEDAYWNLLLSTMKFDAAKAKFIAKEMEQSPHITKSQKESAQALVRMK